MIGKSGDSAQAQPRGGDVVLLRYPMLQLLAEDIDCCPSASVAAAWFRGAVVGSG